MHQKHDIVFEIFNGEKDPCPEKPQRVESVLKEISDIGTFGEIMNIPEELVLAVHDSDYIDFLKKIQDFSTQTNQTKIYPSVWNYSKYLDIKPDSVITAAGNYSFDTFTPFTSQIWPVAMESASLAYSATKFTEKTKKPSYALCRPPGHHATKNKVGGYCYLANASLIAQYLLDFGHKPCILDIDYHHGNGAQEIWYESENVLTISIHRDLVDKFPYYSGFENENGFGSGIGWNYNFCLPENTNEEKYLQTLEKALEIIKTKNCDFLIISAGFDTYKLDPICDFKLEIDTYQKMAKAVNSLKLPTVILQEGGYHIPDLGKCVKSFLSGF